jgi:hypothetical protein
MWAAWSSGKRWTRDGARVLACSRKIPTGSCTVGIVSKAGGEREASGQIIVVAVVHEIQRRGDRRSALQRSIAPGQVLQRRQVTSGEVAADDPGCGAVDHLPGRDPGVPVRMRVAQGAASVVGEASWGREVEDAHRRHTGFVGRMVQEPVHLAQGQIGGSFRDGEQLAHA